MQWAVNRMIGAVIVIFATLITFALLFLGAISGGGPVLPFPSFHLERMFTQVYWLFVVLFVSIAFLFFYSRRSKEIEAKEDIREKTKNIPPEYVEDETYFDPVAEISPFILAFIVIVGLLIMVAFSFLIFVNSLIAYAVCGLLILIFLTFVLGRKPNVVIHPYKKVGELQ